MHTKLNVVTRKAGYSSFMHDFSFRSVRISGTYNFFIHPSAEKARELYLDDPNIHGESMDIGMCVIYLEVLLCI